MFRADVRFWFMFRADVSLVFMLLYYYLILYSSSFLSPLLPLHFPPSLPPILLLPTIWPRMFYRSGWLRCVGFKCIGLVLSFWKIIDVRVGVRLFLLLLLYYILYSSIPSFLFSPSHSPFLFLPPLPFISVFSSLLFRSIFSSILSFKVYVSAFGYPYLYSTRIWPRMFYRSGWLRCDVFNSWNPFGCFVLMFGSGLCFVLM